MVQTVNAILPITNETINLNTWLIQLEQHYDEKGVALIRQSYQFMQLSCEHHNNIQILLTEGIATANTLLNVDADHESICAALLNITLHHSDITMEDISEHINPRIAKLAHDSLQMDTLGNLQNSSHLNIDNFRQMLLTMVDDVRVVLIKLAQSCSQLRSLDEADQLTQRQAAKQALMIYAPLANRLDIINIKWELEDLAFRYLEPNTYKQLAKQLNERRIDRERYVKHFIQDLSQDLNELDIQHEIYGRAKHIYSIYKKMQRKDVPFEEIYDITAVRILVDSIEDCYKALSIVHAKWQHVPQEFDDYITTPKPNGYQSIHTVAIDPKAHKYVEIQIRTHAMHEYNEMGSAAHWSYKEGGHQTSSIEKKVAWLRQLLEWQKEFLDDSELPDELKHNIAEDRVFVFTPNGDVISLPQGATPLDFAYHIHSDIGHQCRGAKIGGKLVPLTYRLQTGERIEVLTAKNNQPSRDWLNPNAGYLASPRARAKVVSYFRKLDHEHNFTAGQAILEKELKRANAKNIDLTELAKHLQLRNSDELYLALGSGTVRPSQINALLQAKPEEKAIADTEDKIKLAIGKNKAKKQTSIQVEGVDDLLTQIAGCCKPLPGDDIVGYITQGHGITIHRDQCNILNKLQEQQPERIIEVSWGDHTHSHYTADVRVEAKDRPDLLRDVTTILSQNKINLLDVKIHRSKRVQGVTLDLTLELPDMSQSKTLINKLGQINAVDVCKRL